MTRWAPGITFEAISHEGGASLTHGALSSKSKYIAPLSQTDCAKHVREDVSLHAERCR